MPTITNYKNFYETNTLDLFNKIEALSSLKPFNLKEADIFHKEAYSRQYKNFSNTYILNGYELPNYLYRYLSYKHFIEYVTKRYITFISPIKWKDPFERRFLKTDYSKYSYIQPSIFCMCATENSQENEDASWRLYGMPNDKVLRIKINVCKLMKFLNDFSVQANFKIYVGKIIYDLSRKEIERIQDHTKENEFYHNYFFNESFSDENYLSLMSLKQDAYKYENEVRLFCCKTPTDSNSDLLLNVPVNISTIVEEIVVGPIYPFDLQDPRSEYFDEYNNLDFKVYSQKLRSILPNIPIFQSKINLIDQLEVV